MSCNNSITDSRAVVRDIHLIRRCIPLQINTESVNLYIVFTMCTMFDVLKLII